MVILGLLLVLLAVGAVITVSMTDTAGGTLPIDVLDRTYNLTALELFIAGVVTAAVFAVGLLMITYGLGRASAKHRRQREARQAERDRLSRLEAEKRDLERRLETSKPPTSDGRDEAGAVTAPHRTVEDRADRDHADRDHADRDRDGVDDRDETVTRPHVSVPAQQQSSDHLVAGGRRSSDDRHSR